MGIADTEIGFPGKIAFCQKVQAAGVISVSYTHLDVYKRQVQTGDNANVIMWAVLLVAAVAAVGAVVIIRRKKK